MVLNADGVITKNKHISLWPITLMINEIPLPTRRYSESIILGGVLPALQHPSNKLFKTVMDIIYEQCIRLEAGVKFFLPDEGERTLKFYLIATCTDKPAQSLLRENFTCCSKTSRKSTIKIFPFGTDPIRTDDICTNLMIEAENHGYPMKGHVGKCYFAVWESPHKFHQNRFILGSCSLIKLKYYSFGQSILYDSLHTLYIGVFKKMCLLVFSKSKINRQQKWSLYNKINSIDQGLAAVKIPTTTSRRFRSIKKLERYKANEFRSLMHHGSTVLLRAKLPKYRRHFALLLAAVNIASKDVIRDCDVKLVKELLQQYVKDWQKIFGLRYMSYNVHSLLHVYESIEFLGPLYMYSTFNFEDLVEEPTKQVNLLQTKVNNVTTTIPNIYIRMHSTCLILRSPSQIKKKHSYRLA
ncbi:unnamed protein product [Rotaria sp. Silwood2]|nr:unnamed protein product [Rotaria sp. Silwood2]CAF4278198.1 unnamed protein product [Rotaria sp. Silwood2]CAF4455386.1 unnamed protein product [Rotaria sp. Silwood2]CAF4496863.1 unnamed protein product [Rotaria sp. Silwood2]